MCIPEPLTPEDGLGHKGGVQAILLGQGLDRQLEGHDVVRGAQGVGVLEVNLMLALGHLVVAGLDLKAHLLQGHADLPPGPLPVVQGAQVEVARLVVGPGGGLALVIGLEEEEFRLRTYVEGIKAHVLGLLQMTRLSTYRGSPTKGVPSGSWTSQISRATLPWLGRQGKMAKESRSG